MFNIRLYVKFLASLKSILGIDKLIIEVNSNDFTVEKLIIRLSKELGIKFKKLIINEKTKKINPDILIFIDKKEIQTLQNLQTLLSDGSQIVFLSSIHGGFKSL
ncbi:MAG: MoaD/ThiS family protein [Candidatus Helarchaeota archaeon]